MWTGYGNVICKENVKFEGKNSSMFFESGNKKNKCIFGKRTYSESYAIYFFNYLIRK